MLGLDGTLCVLDNALLVGPRLWEPGAGRKKLTSSGTGGLAQTAEMLEFCAKHDITADIEFLPSSDVGTALDRLAVGGVRYRFVLDLSDLDEPVAGSRQPPIRLTKGRGRWVRGSGVVPVVRTVPSLGFWGARVRVRRRRCGRRCGASGWLAGRRWRSIPRWRVRRGGPCSRSAPRFLRRL